MNWLDLFGDSRMEVSFSEDPGLDLVGICEDDCQRTAPFIGVLPEESGKEDGSPLDFADYQTRRRGLPIGDRLVNRKK